MKHFIYSEWFWFGIIIGIVLYIEWLSYWWEDQQ